MNLHLLRGDRVKVPVTTRITASRHTGTVSYRHLALNTGPVKAERLCVQELTPHILETLYDCATGSYLDKPVGPAMGIGMSLLFCPILQSPLLKTRESEPKHSTVYLRRLKDFLTHVTVKIIRFVL